MLNTPGEEPSNPRSGGSFCISLDFELMWGVRDKRTISQYGENILGGREATLQMLDLFSDRGVRASWAIVGLLFCGTKQEMLASLPESKPTYEDWRLSNYAYLNEVGENEKEDPYHFAPSLIARIATCPGQEIATHTFSHYYCLEPGQTTAQFHADLDAAIRVAARNHIVFKSIVFPRNQYDDRAIAASIERGITVYRGNEINWMYRTGPRADQSLSRRAARLADSYFNLSGANTSSVERDSAPTNVRSSRFMRPFSSRLRTIEPLRLSRITRAMTVAAKRNRDFHLWLHPHNLGANKQENLHAFRCVLDHFETLRKEYGMLSLAMKDYAMSAQDPCRMPKPQQVPPGPLPSVAQ